MSKHSTDYQRITQVPITPMSPSSRSSSFSGSSSGSASSDGEASQSEGAGERLSAPMPPPARRASEQVLTGDSVWDALVHRIRGLVTTAADLEWRAGLLSEKDDISQGDVSELFDFVRPISTDVDRQDAIRAVIIRDLDHLRPGDQALTAKISRAWETRASAFHKAVRSIVLAENRQENITHTDLKAWARACQRQALSVPDTTESHGTTIQSMSFRSKMPVPGQVRALLSASSSDRYTALREALRYSKQAEAQYEQLEEACWVLEELSNIDPLTSAHEQIAKDSEVVQELFDVAKACQKQPDIGRWPSIIRASGRLAVHAADAAASDRADRQW